jgi:hypothetical protein
MMHTRNHSTAVERAAPTLEKLPHEGSYNRALASLILAVADITSGPTSTSPPGGRGGTAAARRRR